MDELKLCGIEEEDISIVVACGIHRKSTEQEKSFISGDLKNRLKIIDHDADDFDNLIYAGTTSFNNRILLNKIVYDADVRIIICDIDFHQFCGYGGGAKSLLPGVSDRNSIEKNHSMMKHNLAQAGVIDGNPVRTEIDEIGKFFKIDFQIAVVLNSEKEVVDVFAGDMHETFLKGVEICDRMYKVFVPERVDAVVVSCGGYPLDIDLYQTQKSIENAIRIVKTAIKKTKNRPALPTTEHNFVPFIF